MNDPDEDDEIAAQEGALEIQGAYALMDRVARNEGWCDPEMDSYNVYSRDGSAGKSKE
jgi:hypothetical protein